jgi:hypothetical protein
MADIALVTANRVESGWHPRPSDELAAGEDITAGAPVHVQQHRQGRQLGRQRLPPLNTGQGHRRQDRQKRTGRHVLIQEGRLDGYDLSGLAYGDPIFVSDTVGRVGSGSGTAPAVGRVEPVTGKPITSGHDKILNVNIPA